MDFEVEYWVVLLDGEEWWVLVCGCILIDCEGCLIWIIGVV